MKEELTKLFIEKAKAIHGDKYCYEKTVYIKAKDKVIIKCNKHDKDFYQTPDIHLQGAGCSLCSTDSKKDNENTFIIKANIKHNNKYDYSKVIYRGSNSKVEIICKKHNIFIQTATSHLQGRGCPECRRDNIIKIKTEDREIFIIKARKKHNNDYEYEKVKYVCSKDKVIITCKYHGDFLQTPHSHIQGKGCSKCGKESHWRRSDYIKKAKGRITTFYIIRCFNNKESFYKIGITFNNVYKRYIGERDMPYNYEIISEIKGEVGEIWDLELQEKRKLKEYNYQPKIKFGGNKTECFTQYKKEEDES